MSHVVIDGFDFGVDTGVLRDKMDLWDTPIEIVESRKPSPVKKAAAPKVTTNSGKKTAMAAIEAEVKKEEGLEEGWTEFQFDGETYKVAPAEEWDLDVWEAMQDSKDVVAIRSLLGAKQWGKFKSKKRTRTDFDAFWEVMDAAMGVEAGE